MNSTPPRTRAGQPFGFLPSPPPLPRVVARAMACCALVQRAEIEPPAGSADPAVLEGTDDLIDLSLEWLASHGMADELGAAERVFLGARAGTLEGDTRERHGAAGEAAAVLAWALRRAPLPGFEVDADAAEVAAAVGWLSDTGATLGTRALLRDRDQVSAYLDAVSAAHWRLRERTRPDAPEQTGVAQDAAVAGDGDTGAADAGATLDSAKTIGATVSMARWQPDRYAWPEDVTPFALAADGDMALGGRTIAEATPLELYAALRRIRERHRATLWLLGQERDWDAILLNL